MSENTLLACFRDSTDEERALQLLSGYPHPKKVREIRDQGTGFYHSTSSLLHFACRNGWYVVSRELVDKYQCDPRLQNQWRYTPLHYACNRGSIDIVRFLIVDHHCDPACRGWLGRTPLHCACLNENMDIIKCHCHPKIQDGIGDTPLHCLCEQGSIDIVKFLIVDCHCDPACCESDGKTPLHYACESGKLEIVKFLVEECRGDLSVQDINDDTPLNCAVQGESINILRFLIVDCHCEPCGRYWWTDRSLLHDACESGKLNAVKFLVEECHCDPKVEDRFGVTPLHHACAAESIDIARFLIVDHHCDPRVTLHGNTLLHWACGAESIDIIKFLIDHHCDPACRGHMGNTPLHLACKSGKVDVVKFFVEECHCDPRVRNLFGETPLHLACWRGRTDIVRFLIVDHHCNPACRGLNGRTPLHYACSSGKLDLVKFLVEECHCDPFKGRQNNTPLHPAVRREDDILPFLLSYNPPLKEVDSAIKFYSQSSILYKLVYSSVKLLEMFKNCRTAHPLESAFKIFVLGNHGTGKSTLVKVIENEITRHLGSFGSFGGQWRNILESSVVPLTAGIIPIRIQSRRLGQIVIYDMAGHYQYYSSHAALLRSLVSSSSSMLLVVVSLNQEKEEITRQLQYWNSFVDNCCCSAGRPPTVVVFSHADEVAEDKPERKSSEIMKGLAQSEAFSEVVMLDCRKLASGGLTKISKIVAKCCATFRQNFRFEFTVQLLYAFISSRLADRIACTVSELQSLIRQEQGEDSFALKIKDKEYLPANATELSQHLTTLSSNGQLLFLRNAGKVEDSWVVIDKAVLLSEVSGTVFAPENFKQHHKIANSTGVVPFSKIMEVFPNRDPHMVVAFLQHLEFCQEISEAEVSLIGSKHFSSCGPVKRFFFFPALVSEERPSGASEAIDTPSYRCGWTLQCSRPHQFLTTQFLHVLLLRLAFSFALACDDNMYEVKLSPVLERRCFVWKNGIYWLSRKGVETTVEVAEQNTAVTLTISCFPGREMDCIKHRNQVIKCIIECKEELSSTVTMKESLIHPSCLTMPVNDTSLQLFSLSELVEALLENESVLVSQPGKKMIKINQLLYFEPYSCFSGELFRELITQSDKPVCKTFLDKVTKYPHANAHQLKQALGIDSVKFQAALAKAPPFQRDQLEYQCKLVFQVWKENTQSPTYGTLRSALDKYSVFCGRNPLVSCD